MIALKDNSDNNLTRCSKQYQITEKTYIEAKYIEMQKGNKTEKRKYKTYITEETDLNLNFVKNFTAAGPDGILFEILKVGKSKLKTEWKLLFNECLH